MHASWWMWFGRCKNSDNATRWARSKEWIMAEIIAEIRMDFEEKSAWLQEMGFCEEMGMREDNKKWSSSCVNCRLRWRHTRRTIYHRVGVSHTLYSTGWTECQGTVRISSLIGVRQSVQFPRSQLFVRSISWECGSGSGLLVWRKGSMQRARVHLEIKIRGARSEMPSHSGQRCLSTGRSANVVQKVAIFFIKRVNGKFSVVWCNGSAIT